jgi:hypothetical protein
MRPLLRTDLTARDASHANIFRARLVAAHTTRDAPIQQYFLLGGAGTLPGYPYRAFAGRTGALMQAQLTHQIASPWLGARAVAAIGATGHPKLAPIPPSWAVNPAGELRTTDGFLVSAGAGVSLFWDILHVDAVKGLNGGRWVLQVSFTDALRDIG